MEEQLDVSVGVFSHPGHIKKVFLFFRKCLTTVPCHVSQGTELKEEPL